VFGPYRTPPDPPRIASPRLREEIMLGWTLVVLGGLRITVAIATGEV